MTVRQWKIIFTASFAVGGSVLIGFGTNFYVGFGVFFCIWSLAGLLELN